MSAGLLRTLGVIRLALPDGDIDLRGKQPRLVLARLATRTPSAVTVDELIPLTAAVVRGAVGD